MIEFAFIWIHVLRLEEQGFTLNDDLIKLERNLQGRNYDEGATILVSNTECPFIF